MWSVGLRYYKSGAAHISESALEVSKSHFSTLQSQETTVDTLDGIWSFPS